jgi:hypothetical protein
MVRIVGILAAHRIGCSERRADDSGRMLECNRRHWQRVAADRAVFVDAQPIRTTLYG